MIDLQPIAQLPPRPVTELRTDPKHHASALFLLENLRALPLMMTRRENFPIFIYGQWHKPELPITLTNCVRICRIYLTRNTTPGGRELFYTAISEEATRLMNQLSTATKEELGICLAVQGIYVILIVLETHITQPDFIPELVVRRCDIDVMTHIARQCFEYDAYSPFDTDTIDNPNETWEEFIYAESRRRYAVFLSRT
ncbi:hypothetical protein GQX73_g6760 [Xylaria multiplex]|uniref:Uncharacterized protein n=1 Tax=Xylaria multiplex TaxID=323545 RepID=A0A7C8MNV4_9PEZI|nr:hypothetical protein GQX73_g6760 [Xylaria multiplex]